MVCARDRGRRGPRGVGTALGVAGLLTLIPVGGYAFFALTQVPDVSADLAKIERDFNDGKLSAPKAKDAAPGAAGGANAPSSPKVAKQDVGDVEGFTIEDLVANFAPPKTYVDKARNATVLVQSSYGRGSGFFVTQDCQVLTSRHLVAPDDSALRAAEDSLADLRKKASAAARKGDNSLTEMASVLEKELETQRAQAEKEPAKPATVQVQTIDGRRYRIAETRLSKNRDLALLSFKDYHRCPTLPEGPRTLTKGTPLYGIVNPSGSKLDVQSMFFDSKQGQPRGGPWYYTTARTPARASGAPLVTAKGEVVGVRTRVLGFEDEQGLAIPIIALQQEFDVKLGSVGKERPETETPGRVEEEPNAFQDVPDGIGAPQQEEEEPPPTTIDVGREWPAKNW